jgi:FG-GAP repeat.
MASILVIGLAFSVNLAGDINGDGFDDFIIGAFAAALGSNSVAGSSYVVFGNDSGFSSPLELSALDGSNGFVINGGNTNDRSGNSVSLAGDINGDGLDDLIIGADGVDPNGNSLAGSSYVIYGSSSGFSSSMDLVTLNGQNGFVINGINVGERTGFSVSQAGDLNSDGLDDLIIGAPGHPISNGVNNVGASYIVFGNDLIFENGLEIN